MYVIFENKKEVIGYKFNFYSSRTKSYTDEAYREAFGRNLNYLTGEVIGICEGKFVINCITTNSIVNVKFEDCTPIQDPLYKPGNIVASSSAEIVLLILKPVYNVKEEEWKYCSRRITGIRNYNGEIRFDYNHEIEYFYKNPICYVSRESVLRNISNSEHEMLISHCQKNKISHKLEASYINVFVTRFKKIQ